MNFSSDFNNELDIFICDRINETIELLRKENADYKRKRQEHNLEYKTYIDNLSYIDKQRFDKIIADLNSINGDELIAVYKMAWHDLLSFKNKKDFIKHLRK